MQLSHDPSFLFDGSSAKFGSIRSAYFDLDGSPALEEGALYHHRNENVTSPLPISPDQTLPEGRHSSAIPLPPPSQSLLSATSPLPESLPDLSTAHLLGVGDIALPTPPIAKTAASNLRLPSFKVLGIAAPHPDHITPHPKPSILPLGFGPPSQPGDPLHMGPVLGQPFSNCPPIVGDPSPSISPDHVPDSHKAVPQYVFTQTPPDDAGTIDWGATDVKDAAGSMDSSQSPTPTADSTSRQQGGPFSPSGGLGINSSATGYSPPPGTAPWLCEALPIILSNIDREGGSSGHLRILSHALPSPSSAGHAFPSVIDAIEHSTSPNSIVWINVWHAVSGRFSLEDLPKSPPTTPAPPHGGDDYFTTKVFNMAVEVPDYSQKKGPAQPLLQTPRPAISPSSIDVSIVERYIPPGSSIEFAELFSPTGQSFLSDRLVELSPDHGTLLFIYPTKTGGETFKKEYIGPILDPLLREMGTAHDLSTDILVDIGAMPATDKLVDFEEMTSQLTEFCRALGSGEGSSTPHGRFHRQGTDYSIIHSSKQEVKLDRQVWARDWWNKQEKAKIQRAFQEHHLERAGPTVKQGAGTAKASSHVATATQETEAAAGLGLGNDVLLQRVKTEGLMRAYQKVRGEKRPEDNEQLILDLLQRVATRPYKGEPPARGIEVGVFIIRKSMRRPGVTRPPLIRATDSGYTRDG